MKEKRGGGGGVCSKMKSETGYAREREKESRGRVRNGTKKPKKV